MATIHQFSIGQNEKKYFSYLNGSISELSESDFNEKRIATIGMSAYAGVTPVRIGDAHTGVDQAIYAQFYGDSIWRNRAFGAISFVIRYTVRTPQVEIRGSVTPGESVSGGDSGGEGGASVSQTDFGVGDPPVSPPTAPTTTPVTPLPTGNGNFGFTTPGSAGAELGITGGNS